MQRLVDLAERVFIVLLAVPFAVAFARTLPTHPAVVLVCASELLAAFFIVVRRSAIIRLSGVAVFTAFCGTALPLLVRPGGQQLVPAAVSSILMVGGLGLSVASKLYLNRSFGIIAANRGVKTTGPYRLVRHPMYLGYMITQAGFLLFSFSVTTFALYATTWTFQLIRVREEEFVLCGDPEYRNFSCRVPARLIPGIY